MPCLIDGHLRKGQSGSDRKFQKKIESEDLQFSDVPIRAIYGELLF